MTQGCSAFRGGIFRPSLYNADHVLLRGSASVMRSGPPLPTMDQVDDQRFATR